MVNEHVTRKKLQPFGGIAATSKLQKIKEEALRTLSRQECFDRGFLTVQELDDEELRYGRCRDNSGRIPRITGKTELIPRELYDEMVAEHELRYKQKIRQNLDDMIDIMVNIAKDDTVEPRERFEAAKYLFERTAGRTPESVTVNIKTAPWEDLFSQVAGIASVSRQEHKRLTQESERGAGILEAEVIDYEDGDEVYAEQDGSGADDVQDTVPSSEGEGLRAGQVPGQEPNSEQRSDVAGRVPPVQGPDNDLVYTEGDINTYGRRHDEGRSYAQQIHDAEKLRQRRKEAKAKIQQAKKQRKIDRAMGADAIKDEITGINVDSDGNVTFE